MPSPDTTARSSWISTLASVAVLVGAIYLAKDLLVPIAIAVLLSFLLSPACDWLERHGLGRILAVVSTAMIGFALIGVVFWTAALQISHLVPNIPTYRQNIVTKLNSANEHAVVVLSQLTRTVEGLGRGVSPSDSPSVPAGTTEQPFAVRIVAAPTSPLQVFGGMFGTLLETLATMGVVIVLVVFSLLRREDLRNRFIHLVGQGHVTLTTQLLEDAGLRVSRYLTMLFLVNMAFGVSVGVGLYLIGIPNAVLWGILAAVLRFIPYIGPWIAAAMPIGLSFAISPGWIATVLTVGLFVLLELFNNNLLEPWLYGKNTGVSAIAVLVAAVFWTWLWGPMGLLLATPLTVCILVIGKHIPQLSFLDILLGTEQVFDPKTQIYQRLLAGDQEEAAELLASYLEHRPLVEVYDSVLIPAMAAAERHWQLGELSEAKHSFIMQSLREMLQEQADRQLELKTKSLAVSAQAAAQEIDRTPTDQSSLLRVLCLPARSEADEIAALFLAQVLESKDYHMDIVPVASLAERLTAFSEMGDIKLICVSATPPAAIMHARRLCQRLRGQLPDVRIIVGLWDTRTDLHLAASRIGCGASVVTTLADAAAQIAQSPAPLQP